MNYEDFLKIAKYGNEMWKGSFTEEEMKQNANDYFVEYELSNKQGKPTFVIEELCKLLLEDGISGSIFAEEYLCEIVKSSQWEMVTFFCKYCNKMEIVFFSKEELENIQKHSNREITIQNAIPEKPQWIRETFVSGMCLCPECWNKYWKGEFI